MVSVAGPCDMDNGSLSCIFVFPIFIHASLYISERPDTSESLSWAISNHLQGNQSSREDEGQTRFLQSLGALGPPNPKFKALL
jgi:hypothetical protein